MTSSSRPHRAITPWHVVTGDIDFERWTTKGYFGLAHSIEADELRPQGRTDGVGTFAHEADTYLPLEWKKHPRLVAVAPAGDLLHPEVPDDFIYRCFATMTATPWHAYLVHTLYPERLAELASSLPKLPNVWIGSTVTSNADVSRSHALHEADHGNVFLVLDPLRGPIDPEVIELADWIIACEDFTASLNSTSLNLIRGVRDTCRRELTPFRFGRLGRGGDQRQRPMIDGVIWDEIPALDGVTC